MKASWLKSFSEVLNKFGVFTVHLDVDDSIFGHMPFSGSLGLGNQSIMMVDAQSGIPDDGMKVRLWPVRVTIRTRA